ncbi:lysyl oxidase homolog 2 isoform X3 [Hyalella azteca]|uniref:protein-lysine 6-oxidase n=1 Tax=Hyalella azteca TaxID=294128 RepID=A0A8B7NUU2_HYAAZ|nr:lysyl oxidase homolog 2 isoform X3 [Hyalella azteca]
MLPKKLLVYVIIAMLVVSLVADEASAVKRRRRRRRRNRPEDINAVRRGARRNGRRLRHATSRREEFVKRRLRKFRNRDGDYEGKTRLVDGRAEFEGNVEIYHDGKWGNVCDDEWDLREGEIVCKGLGFPDVNQVTYNGFYGHIRHQYWLDNLFCFGNEKNISSCKHDGWGKHDCQPDEAAGVVCMTHFSTTTEPPTTTAAVPLIPIRDEPANVKRSRLQDTLGGDSMELSVAGGRVPEEGRVEIFMPGSNSSGLICGDGWSLLEAAVVCRQLGYGYAQSAPSTGFFGGNMTQIVLSGVKCRGNEERLDECLHAVPQEPGLVKCLGPPGDLNIAGVTCVQKMADLVPDTHELMRSVHLEDKQLFFLQCAMEENCLASTAYEKEQKMGYGWHLETRRLLRFTARIANQGDDAFLPFLPKHYWEWHHCHMHYHSMEVFAHYDIMDAKGKKVAEGHKASFCLEDNNCLPGIEPYYKCANFGDQGISPGCTDTYAYNIDCQWVDITDLEPGDYTFKLEINPDFKVGEQSFMNNAARCELKYSVNSAWIGNCSLGRPGPD